MKHPINAKNKLVKTPLSPQILADFGIYLRNGSASNPFLALFTEKKFYTPVVVRPKKKKRKKKKKEKRKRGERKKRGGKKDFLKSGGSRGGAAPQLCF